MGSVPWSGLRQYDERELNTRASRILDYILGESTVRPSSLSIPTERPVVGGGSEISGKEQDASALLARTTGPEPPSPTSGDNTNVAVNQQLIAGLEDDKRHKNSNDPAHDDSLNKLEVVPIEQDSEDEDEQTGIPPSKKKKKSKGKRHTKKRKAADDISNQQPEPVRQKVTADPDKPVRVSVGSLGFSNLSTKDNQNDAKPAAQTRRRADRLVTDPK